MSETVYEIPMGWSVHPEAMEEAGGKKIYRAFFVNGNRKGYAFSHESQAEAIKEAIAYINNEYRPQKTDDFGCHLEMLREFTAVKITAGDNGFSLDVIDRAREFAEDSKSVKPICVDGSEYYVVTLNNSQLRQLRENTSKQGIDWLDVQQAAMCLPSNPEQHPIFKGACGAYNGVIVRKEINDNNYALLCGEKAYSMISNFKGSSLTDAALRDIQQTQGWGA